MHDFGDQEGHYSTARPRDRAIPTESRPLDTSFDFYRTGEEAPMIVSTVRPEQKENM